jgi:hypothetical protein
MVILPALGILMAIIVTRGRYLWLLKGQWTQIKFWRRNVGKRYVHMVRGRAADSKKFYGKIFSWATHIPLLPLLPVNYFSLMILYWPYQVLILKNNMTIPPLYNDFVWWIALLFMWAVMTSNIKPLRCIGEGMRYLEYGVLPVAIVSAYFLNQSILTGQKGLTIISIILVVLSLITIIVLQIKLVLQNRTHSVNNDLRKIYLKLDDLAHDGKIMIITFPEALSMALRYFTNENVETFYPVFDSANSLLEGVVPLLTRSLDEMASQYGITHCVVDLEYVKPEELKLKDWSVVNRSGDYVIIAIGKK